MNLSNQKTKFLFATHLVLVAVFTVIFFSSIITPANAAADGWHIKDDATGGECSVIGSWNAGNKTCTLSQDLSQGIIIDSGNITLDGSGRTITGSNTGNGVYFSGRTGVTIKNLSVKKFSYGIYLSSSSDNILRDNNVNSNAYGIVLSSSSNNTLTGNTADSNNFRGIALSGSDNNTLTGNTASNNSGGITLYGSNSNTITGNTANSSSVGIYLSSSNNNTLTGNTTSNNSDGILLQSSSNNTLTGNTASSNNYNGIQLGGSSNNTLTGNTASNNYYEFNLSHSNNNTLTGNTTSNSGYGISVYGIYLWFSSNNILTGNTVSNNTYVISAYSSTNNQIYNNNFNNNFSNSPINNGGNIFNLATPTGGNYWSNFDESAEGCNNANGDNFCDLPYVFQGGQDNLPWTKQDGWLASSNNPPTTFWAAIENGPQGALRLRSSTATADDSNVLKELPNGWALYVKDTHNDELKTSGHIWWEVEDKTDGATGWMATAKLDANGSIVENYLSYEADRQSELEGSATKTYDTRIDRANKIVEVVKSYYNNLSTAPSLYSSNDGSNKLSLFKEVSFPEQLIFAIIAQESGGIDFNNEHVAFDYGHGIMQVTFKGYWNEPDNYLANDWDNRGIASHVKIFPCKSIASNEYYKCYTDAGLKLEKPKPYKYYNDDPNNLIYKQYINTEQSIFSNIKDGLRVLQNKYNAISIIGNYTDTWTQEGVTITLDDMKKILAVRGYNGFGPNCTRFNVDVEHLYLGPVADKLRNLNNYFDSSVVSPYSNADNLIRKLELAEDYRDSIDLCSPGVIQILDSQGRTMSLEKNEIPNVFYNEEHGKQAEVYFSDSGYQYQVIGTDEGTYSLYIDHGTITSFVALDIPIQVGAVHSFRIDWDALAQGEKAVTLQIDTDGDGIVEKNVIADSNLTYDEFILQTQTVIDFKPDTLNLKSKGEIITTYIELPNGFMPNKIDTASIMLNGIIPSLEKPVALGDYDNDGVADLMVKFNREEVRQLLMNSGERAEARVSGSILHNNEYLEFAGVDYIKLIK